MEWVETPNTATELVSKDSELWSTYLRLFDIENVMFVLIEMITNESHYFKINKLK